MADIWLLLATLAVIGAALSGLPWLAARARRRRVCGSFLGVADEIFHPHAHQARIVIEVQSERKESMPSADDL